MKRISIIISMLALLLSSCTQKGEIPNVAFNEEVLNVDAQMGNYNVDIVANCPWQITLADEYGETPSWLDLTKSVGNGQSVTSLRVYSNKYNAERKAVMTIKSLTSNATAFLDIVQASAGGGEGVVSEDFRMGSYNLRMSGLDTDDENKWEVRKDRLATSIRENSFDVFGVQEVSTTQQKWLQTEFADEFECYFFSPYSGSGVGDKAHGILYKKGQYTIAETHFFWMGDNPHSMSKSDTGTAGDFCRGGCCAIMTHKASGIKFFFMCSHGCLNSGPNAAYAYIYEQMEKEYNKEGLPSLFVGDLNAGNTSPAYAEYSAYWKDAYVNAAEKKGAGGTFNGYTSATGKSRIDYIFYRGGGIKAKLYCCNNNRFGGLYASDHFPIYMDCTITVNK